MKNKRLIKTSFSPLHLLNLHSIKHRKFDSQALAIQ